MLRGGTAALLPGEEGRGFSQDLLLLLEPRVLTPKSSQLLSLRARHIVLTLATVDLVLLEPVPQTRLSDPQLPRDLRDRTLTLAS